ncbi:MAG: hypothetical protein ACLGIA_14280 [Actinomycetes bacterium]
MPVPSSSAGDDDRPRGRAASATVAGTVSAAVAAACWGARSTVPGGARRWERTNHRGEPLSLLEGPAWAAGAVAGLLVARLPPSLRWGAVLATAGGAVFGVVDDLAERGASKGLRGHLGALARGELTTGGLKVLGIGATGLLAAPMLLSEGSSGRGGPVRRVVDVAVGGALVAGSANLANLLDLRPGRVLKVVGLLAPVLASSTRATPLAAAGVGASVALAAPDLGEEAMLGDCGANAAGALLGAGVLAGTAATGSRGSALRAGVLAGVLALTLASERVSFTRVIESTPGLRELDALGRRPAPVPGPPPA